MKTNKIKQLAIDSCFILWYFCQPELKTLTLNKLLLINMKVILTALCCFGSLSLFSQDYSYSFSGKLTEEQQQTIISQILESPGVESCKMKYKTDSERGEILIDVTDQTLRSEDQSLFSPSSVKSILIGSDLQPLDFRSIK